MCGDYHMTIDRSEKDALKMTPNAGLTLWEQMGMASKTSRFVGGGLEQLGAGPDSARNAAKQFDRLEQFAKLQAPPPVKYKDLEEIVNTKIVTNLMPFDVRTDFVKVTGDTVLVPITIQLKYRDITFANKDGVQRGTVNIFMRVSTLTGRIVQTQEEPVQVMVPAELLPRTRGEFGSLLEGAAAASGTVQGRNRGERRERRPQGPVEPRDCSARVLGRQTGEPLR